MKLFSKKSCQILIYLYLKLTYFENVLKVLICFTFSDKVDLNLTQLSILDFETDEEISNAVLDWFNERFDAKITVPQRKSYFSIRGTDSNQQIFQRFLKQIPFKPIFYSIEFERDLTNNSINKYNVMVKSSNKYMSTIGLDLFSDKSDLFSFNISPQQINASNGEIVIFSSEFFFKEEIESIEMNIVILPIIKVNNSNTIYFKKKTINVYYAKDESLKNETESGVITSDSSYQVTTSYFENQNLSTMITEKNASFFTRSDYQNISSLSNQITSTNLLNTSFAFISNSQSNSQMTNSTKKIEDNVRSKNFVIKIINFIYWLINCIITLF